MFEFLMNGVIVGGSRDLQAKRASQGCQRVTMGRYNSASGPEQVLEVLHASAMRIPRNRSHPVGIDHPAPRIQCLHSCSAAC
ncbi:hypothetical protein [Methylobacterium planeticum]|uniref:Uncharacterized protein n=1 Tax=Methylobacterium planeticum TaxID=2615211 RepID=A0A6N6MI38_9HYPH|nr:hypothetical protein [Methylobacterium planeticum]KAB1070037.1 hypothetical protein F6X51_23985 [Methylobacterium planeticum]